MFLTLNLHQANLIVAIVHNFTPPPHPQQEQLGPTTIHIPGERKKEHGTKNLLWLNHSQSNSSMSPCQQIRPSIIRFSNQASSSNFGRFLQRAQLLAQVQVDPLVMYQLQDLVKVQE